MKAIFRLRAARAARLRHRAWRRAGERMSTTAVADDRRGRADDRFWTRPRRVGVGLLALGVLAAVVFGALATGAAAPGSRSAENERRRRVWRSTARSARSCSGSSRRPPAWALLAGVAAALVQPWLLGVGIVGVRAVVPVLAGLRRPAKFMPLVDIVRRHASCSPCR